MGTTSGALTLLACPTLPLCPTADVIITKAGPGTISEALICGLPMVLNAFVPCQEEGNIPYVVDNKVGSRAGSRGGSCQLLPRVGVARKPALASV